MHSGSALCKVAAKRLSGQIYIYIGARCSKIMGKMTRKAIWDKLDELLDIPKMSYVW